jgi:hypothetical protein
VDPAAAPMTVQPILVVRAANASSIGQPTNTALLTPITEATQVAEVKAPAVRGRRKRPRVVAPAGPPRGAGQPEAASSEFGS